MISVASIIISEGQNLKENFTKFGPLKIDGECYKCCNYGHKPQDCEIQLLYA